MEFPKPSLTNVFDARVTRQVDFLCKLLVLVGSGLHVLFYTGPPVPLTLSVVFFGGGVTAYAAHFLYQKQPRMQMRHLAPYLAGIGVAVAAIAIGIGYGYVDRRVGLPFFIVIAITLVLFARFFQYDPDLSAEQY